LAACQNGGAPSLSPVSTPAPLAVELVTQDLTVGENRLAMVFSMSGVS
jgi:hypothetical protein